MEEKKFTAVLEKLLPTYPAHADLFNALFTTLLHNDLFLKEAAGALEKENRYSRNLEEADLLTVEENGIYYVKKAENSPAGEEGYLEVFNHPVEFENCRTIFWRPYNSNVGGYFNVLTEDGWLGWQQIATSQEVNIGLNNKTDKNEYKVYTPYGEGENTEENPCDLYKLDRGSAVLPALVSVKNSPFPENKVRDATVFVPSRYFGWQLLGEFQGLFYQRFDWEGNPWGNWEQIAFASMLFNRNLLYNADFKLNQRGQSKYHVTNRYSVDRWMGWNTIITPCKNGIDIEIAGTGYWEFRQYLEYKKKDLLGKYLTMSICADGMVYSKTFDQIPDSIEATWGNDKNIFGALNTRVTVKEDIFIFWIYNNGSQSYHIDWMKLEFGRIATPFIPPNPATELMECQRYYKRIYLGALSAYQYYTEKNRVYFNYHFGAMRTKTPTVAFVGMKAEANYPTENYFAVTKGGNAVLGWSVSKDVQFEIILNNYENVSIIATLPDSIPVTNKDFTLHFGKGAGIEVDDEIYP